MNSTVFSRAEEFIWKHARLLDRQLFAYHYKGGSRQAVLDALRAYQNPDGGFGNALEPDLRCPDSQPIPAQHAIEYMQEVGLDLEMLQRLCGYLQTITTPEGGLPFVLPSVMHYPHPPWMETSGDPPASINPTAAIAGLLHKHKVQHAWLQPATDYCWSQIADLVPAELNQMDVILTFLYHVPERRRAEAELERLVPLMFAAGLVAEIHAEGYVRKPLDWAPTPDHPLRKYFPPELIRENLAFALASQQADGGWGITWPPLSPVVELEWRGWITVTMLLTLQANGALA